MKRATALLATVMAVAWVPAAGLSHAQTLTPGLFEKASYQGTKVSVVQSEPNLQGKYGTSFTPSSATGVTGLQAAMYDKINYEGVCMELGENLRQFSSTLLADNATKSVKLGETCGGEALLFGNPRYNSGSTTCIGFECALNKAGPRHALPIPGSAATPTVLHDVASVLTKPQSILLPYGGAAAAYSEPGFGGICKTIRKPVDDLVAAGIDIKSLQLGRTCEKAVQLFSGPAENGTMVHTDGDVPDILALKVKDKLVDWSLTNTRPDSVVSVFTGRFFKGACKEVKGEDASQPFGVAHNLTVGSVRAGKCADAPGVRLYPSKSFAGAATALVGDQPDLGAVGKNAASVVNGTDDPYAAFEGAGYTGACWKVAPRSADDDLKGKLVHNLIGSMKRGGCPPVATLHYHSAAEPLDLEITSSVSDLGDVGANDAAFAISNLSSTTLSLYREVGFQGACQNVAANTTVENLEGSVVGYHDLSSIKVGPCTTQVQLFGQVGYTGGRRAFGADQPDLTAQSFDDVSSSVVNNTDVVVALYSQADYHARCQELDPGESVSDLANSPVGNDTISSVRVGEPCRAIALLFDGTAYAGTFLGLAEDAPDLTVYNFSSRATSIVNNTGRTISVYGNVNFKGRCQNVPPDTAIPTLVGSIVHDDATQSLKVSGPCPHHLVMYKNAPYWSTFLAKAQTTADLRDANFDDVTASVVNNTAGPVAMYSNPDYLGDCQTLAPGQAVADLDGAGNLRSGRLSSFRLNATC
ncbi:MAG TPA: peptidase inhibitor family I36 protein [Acidimicrobiales bacterium]|nr:peptidase inhibitor family I36 protein [Acidimicrobiales bacterium]